MVIFYSYVSLPEGNDWLVVWNMFIFPYIGNFIIPTDELIFFRGVGIPPASHGYRYKMLSVSSTRAKLEGFFLHQPVPDRSATGCLDVELYGWHLQIPGGTAAYSCFGPCWPSEAATSSALPSPPVREVNGRKRWAY